jgi:hypothetical protein
MVSISRASYRAYIHTRYTGQLKLDKNFKWMYHERGLISAAYPDMNL